MNLQKAYIPIHLDDNQWITLLSILELFTKYSKNENEIRAAKDLHFQIEGQYNLSWEEYDTVIQDNSIEEMVQDNLEYQNPEEMDVKFMSTQNIFYADEE